MKKNQANCLELKKMDMTKFWLVLVLIMTD